MQIVSLMTDPDFLMALFAAIAAAAMVFTFGAQFFEKAEMKDRIKRVALERERLRAEEMARLRGGGEKDNPVRGTARRTETKAYMKRVVEGLSLQKAFVDDKTMLQLQMAGFRGQNHLTTFLFFRLVSPFLIFGLAFMYLGFVVLKDMPLYLVALYAITIGLLGAYAPTIYIKNKAQKRQASIRKAWPDSLDLMLLCVESGMSVEHAFKRVAREIGHQSAELAEELTLTTAELSFLEDRTRAYDNLAKRTGLDGVRSVMTALIQADRYGTSVGSSLRVMAEEGREQRMMEAEKKAAALPPKLTVPLILFFLPVLFIVIMAPAGIKIAANGGLGNLFG